MKIKLLYYLRRLFFRHFNYSLKNIRIVTKYLCRRNYRVFLKTTMLIKYVILLSVLNAKLYIVYSVQSVDITLQ